MAVYESGSVFLFSAVSAGMVPSSRYPDQEE